MVQSGDTACLQPTLDVFRPEDRQLLQSHCHARALAILRAQLGGAEGEAHTREAIAYLSLAIFAAGRSCLPAPGGPSCARYMGSLCLAGCGGPGGPGCVRPGNIHGADREWPLAEGVLHGGPALR